MEKKLDDILGWFQTKKTNSGYVRLNFEEFGLEPGESYKILHLLYKDGHILSPDENSLITAKGIMFLNDGGYMGKKKRDQETHESIINQTRYSKKSFWISIIAISIALVSLALQFF